MAPKKDKGKADKGKGKKDKGKADKGKGKKDKGKKDKGKKDKGKGKKDKGKKDKGKAGKAGPSSDPECFTPVLVYPVALVIALGALFLISQVFGHYKKVMESTEPYKEDMKKLREAIGEWLSNDTLKENTDLAIIQLVDLEEHIERELQVFDQRRMDYAKAFLTKSARGLWIRYGLRNYYISQREKNWFDAERYCAARDSHLASILNYEEQDFITSQILEPSWIGLSKQNAFGAWEWTDKSAFTTQYWQNATSKSQQKGKEQDCVTIGPTINIRNWEQANCYKLNRWVCKNSRQQDKS